MEQLSYGPFISREQAKEQGLKHFFTGKPCKNGHVSVRYVSTKQCKACVYAHTAAKSPEEQERLRLLRRQWEKKKIKEEPRYYADRAYARMTADREKWNEEARERASQYTLKNGCARSTKRRRENIDARLAANLRRRLNKAVFGQACSSSTLKMLGCSVSELHSYLEGKFLKGMTWENYGVHGWHVDHIRPCASFENPADPHCWHYTNLQPLWAKDNLAKSDHWEPEAA